MRDVTIDPKGLRKFMQFVDSVYSGRAAFSSFSSDAEWREDMRSGVLSYTSLYDEPQSVTRRKLRYLVALLPDVPAHELPQVLHGVVDNRHLSVQDVRFILDGRSLADPQIRLREVPVSTLQSIGRMLYAGASHVDVSQKLRVSLATVRRVDDYCGISDAYRNALMDAAVLAVGSGESVRQFARRKGLSVSTAHRVILRAKEVLGELGETVEVTND